MDDLSDGGRRKDDLISDHHRSQNEIGSDGIRTGKKKNSTPVPGMLRERIRQVT